MKIEWAVGLHLDVKEETRWHVPVVRLAEVDAVLAEAVWAMEQLQNSVRNFWSDALATDESALCVDEAAAKDARYQRAQAFLSSQVVTDWRKRQKEEP